MTSRPALTSPARGLLPQPEDVGGDHPDPEPHDHRRGADADRADQRRDSRLGEVGVLAQADRHRSQHENADHQQHGGDRLVDPALIPEAAPPRSGRTRQPKAACWCSGAAARNVDRHRASPLSSASRSDPGSGGRPRPRPGPGSPPVHYRLPRRRPSGPPRAPAPAWRCRTPRRAGETWPSAPAPPSPRGRPPETPWHR